jgi:hypothetical protein
MRPSSSSFFVDSFNAGRQAGKAVAFAITKGWAASASLEVCEDYADGPTGWRLADWRRGYLQSLKAQGYAHLA